jgi:hypothetical protein
MKQYKIRPLSRVRPQVEEMDSVKESKKLGDRRAFEVLLAAQLAWSNMDRFRKDRERNKRYAYGDQWGDMICDDEGENITEESYIKKQGSVPLKQNLIRRLVRAVLGVYRGQDTEPICKARDRSEQKMGETLTTLLQYNNQTNRAKEVNARSMEEYLISGFVMHRKWYGWNEERQRLDCWTNYVQPNNAFIDSNMRDFRGWDCKLIGEVHDESFNTVVGKWAHSEADYKKLAQIYAPQRRTKSYMMDHAEEFGFSRLENYDFLLTSDPTRCRVIEVWRKESKPRYRCHDYNTGEVFKCELQEKPELVDAVNADRMQRGLAAGMTPEDIPMITAEWFIDNYWYYYFLTPFGDILDEGETPYSHKSHPYVFKAYPYIDGEIHSFVSDVIDQQRYTNRLITMYDWIMRASAKGVLLIPEQVIEDSKMSMDEIADEWHRFNGVIAYRAKPGIPIPQQVAANSVNIGIAELLNLQLKFFQDISGVNGPLQGQADYSGQSNAMYQQQTANAQTTLLDITESFSGFLTEAAYKDIKNIQQFYDDRTIYNIAGDTLGDEEVDAKLHDMEVDISITQSKSSPVYRAAANQFLLHLLELGAINIEQMLENGDFDFADNLLQSIRSQREQMAQGQMPQGVDPALMAQAQQGADMNAVNQAYNMMRGAA